MNAREFADIVIKMSVRPKHSDYDFCVSWRRYLGKTRRVYFVRNNGVTIAEALKIDGSMEWTIPLSKMNEVKMKLAGVI